MRCVKESALSGIWPCYWKLLYLIVLQTQQYGIKLLRSKSEVHVYNYVSDPYITQSKMCNQAESDEFTCVKCIVAYKEHKRLKVQLEEELLAIAWHPCIGPWRGALMKKLSKDGSM